jgi:uncharacterized membrane protein
MALGTASSWWVIVGLVAGALAAACFAYAGAAVPLSARQRGALRALRATTLLLLVTILLRPLLLDQREHARNAVVPVLIDTSRSMALADAGGQTRLAYAKDLVERRLLPVLNREFQVDVLRFGDEVAKADLATLEATARRSDLSGAIAAVRERYANRTIAGIVVVSDGGDTGSVMHDAIGSDVPVFPIGVGATRVARDREIVGVSVGEASLAASVVDLSVAVVSHGFGREPLELTVREDGRPIQVRTIAPAGDGSPVLVVFQVSPKKEAATLYTVEVTPDASEITPENNVRSALVAPPGRRRRLLLVEGAPGFEHSFLKRALDADPGLEVDAIVRKGQNERGADTFYVQAAEARATSLLEGYPATREALDAYDSVAFANLEADFFTRDQLAMTADFVSERGGGLLVLGAGSFEHQSWLRTPIEDVLPVELADRGALAVRAGDRAEVGRNRALLTSDGERHPVMRVGNTVDDTRARWSSAPELAATAAVGGPRPGATVLAEAIGEGSVARPLVAIQRYGEGRTMIFAGEASWRWKMMRPSDDRLYDAFWRQAIRWLASAAPDPVAVAVPSGAMAGDAVPVTVTLRDQAFTPVNDATVTLTATGPGGGKREVPTVAAEAGTGQQVGRFRAEEDGVYRVRAEARRGGRALGAAETFLLVGGANEELADPRLNDEVLRRVASGSGGYQVDPHDLNRLREVLARRAPEPAPRVPREIWHHAWTFFLIAGLVCAEWALRRRWGMR